MAENVKCPTTAGGDLLTEIIARNAMEILRRAWRLVILDFVCRPGRPRPGWVVVAIPCAGVAS
jgi:hypothetical protein